MVDNMMDLFFHEESGSWYDYNMESEEHNTNFYPSNLSPLFTQCYRAGKLKTNNVLKYILVRIDLLLIDYKTKDIKITLLEEH